MPDYRSYFDSEYLGSWDLQGRDVTVTIAKVVGADIVGEGGKKAKKPVVYFEGKQKGMIFNKTNSRIVAAMYGNDTAAWVGKSITLFATQTSVGAEMKDCIRVKPLVPATPAAAAEEG